MYSKANKKRNIHGIVSILLVLIAMIIGIYAIAQFSIKLALLNIFILILFLLSVSYYYCSKCPTRDRCNHLIFGKISRMLRKSSVEKYNTFDLLFGAILPLCMVIGIPQYWLLFFPSLMLVYWVLMLVAAAEIFFFVCNKCENQKCSMCRNREIIKLK